MESNVVNRINEAVSRDLINYITEFLAFHDFPRAVAVLQEERNEKRIAFSKSVCNRPSGKESREKLRADLIRYFEEGKRDAFLQTWQQYIPNSSVNYDLITQKLEFNLQVYLSIYPVLPSSSVLVVTNKGARGGGGSDCGTSGPPGSSGGSSSIKGNKEQELTVRMKAFKAYLETRGAGLANTGEFLAYYALPFVPSPEHHPSFKHLFLPDWVSSLRASLKKHLDSVPDSAGIPHLYAMYEVFHASTDAETRMSPRALISRHQASTRHHNSSRQGSTRPMSQQQRLPLLTPSSRTSSTAASGSEPSAMDGGDMEMRSRSRGGSRIPSMLPLPGVKAALSPAPQTPLNHAHQTALLSSSAVTGNHPPEQAGNYTPDEEVMSKDLPGDLLIKEGLAGHDPAATLASSPGFPVLVEHSSYIDELEGMDEVLMSTVVVPAQLAQDMAVIAAFAALEDAAADEGCNPMKNDASMANEHQGAGVQRASGGAEAARGQGLEAAQEQGGGDEAGHETLSPANRVAELGPPESEEVIATVEETHDENEAGYSDEDFIVAEDSGHDRNHGDDAVLGAARHAVDVEDETADGATAVGTDLDSVVPADLDAQVDLVEPENVVMSALGYIGEPMLAPLDYYSIVAAIMSGSKPTATIDEVGLSARLLQALRWRLVRSRAGQERWAVLTTWIEVDLMRCCLRPKNGKSQKESMLQALSESDHLPIKEEVARLANAVSSDRLGRVYLLQEPEAGTVLSLMAMLQDSAKQPALQEFIAVGHAGPAPGSSTSVHLSRYSIDDTPATSADMQMIPMPPKLLKGRSFSRQGSSSSGRPFTSMQTSAVEAQQGLSAAKQSLCTDDGVPTAIGTSAAVITDLVPGNSRNELLGATVQEEHYGGAHGVIPPILSSSTVARLLGSANVQQLQSRPSSKSMASFISSVPRDDNLEAAAQYALHSTTKTKGDLGSVLLLQSLMALQKLSLRRQAQSCMIKEGLLPWLVEFMQDFYSLPETCVEYGCALLMNLCLRTAGRSAACSGAAVADAKPAPLAGSTTQGADKPAQGVAPGLLRICEGLVESKNMQVRTYINGILYSVLFRAEMREEAMRRGLPDLLRAVSAQSSELFASQISYILSRLEGDVAASQEVASSEQLDSDDAEKEEGDAYYDDDDAFADVEAAVESLVVEPPGSLQGEPLLCSEYLAGSEEAQEQAHFMRVPLQATAASEEETRALEQKRGHMASMSSMSSSTKAWAKRFSEKAGQPEILSGSESLAYTSFAASSVAASLHASRAAAAATAAIRSEKRQGSMRALLPEESSFFLSGSIAYFSVEYEGAAQQNPGAPDGSRRSMAASVSSPPGLRKPSSDHAFVAGVSGPRNKAYSTGLKPSRLSAMPLERPITPTQLSSNLSGRSKQDTGGTSKQKHVPQDIVRLQIGKAKSSATAPMQNNDPHTGLAKGGGELMAASHIAYRDPKESVRKTRTRMA
ncbi:hypothetical protein CEUSTIGMA_g8187.t1 [Chlamydomonas eustigma]|uniref:LisH domain-containing protein n=1 Tax=Chlamydomonas eustigma TaxID=1157962 RepID=A0A250XCY9_9CHLO|nr:hypothetical protein CEUSTIGMA_g8187.t1 [Chlamydomonas eustigma]|eukprot:GAX80752.1 hypothetical protein CEUSTIGMA_g8187.t1 [Chlamydomonas eustigma]